MEAEPDRQSYLECVGATVLTESRPADCRFKMVHHYRVLVSIAIALEALKVQSQPVQQKASRVS